MYWKEPDKFNQDRFIDGRREIIKNVAVIPFGVVPRIYPGEYLVRMELFLVLASVLQWCTAEREYESNRHSTEQKPNRVIGEPFSK